MRRPGENRAMHRARLSRQRRVERKGKYDTRTGVADDLTTTTLHPTKGFRRISGKRVEARFMLQAIYSRAATKRRAHPLIVP